MKSENMGQMGSRSIRCGGNRRRTWDNPIPVEFIKDAIEKSKDLKTGDKVSIEARINGREWQGKDGVTKWFTSISGYKVAIEGGNAESIEPDSSSYDTFDEYDDGYGMRRSD